MPSIEETIQYEMEEDEEEEEEEEEENQEVSVLKYEGVTNKC
jgi:hypothetical protein